MQTLAVLSMKGGVGKTTVTLGMASAAWQRGERVLVIDLDPQGNATMGLGVANPEFTMNDVLADPRPGIAADAIVDSAWGNRVQVLAADRALEHRNTIEGPLSSQRLRIALGNLPRQYDLVLIDCPPSLGEMTRNALHAATDALVVTEPAYFALAGAEQAVEAVDVIRLASNPMLNPARIVLNRVRPTVAEHRNRSTSCVKLSARSFLTLKFPNAMQSPKQRLPECLSTHGIHPPAKSSQQYLTK